MGYRRPSPKAFQLTLIPGAACCLLYSLLSTILSMFLTSSEEYPISMISGSVFSFLIQALLVLLFTMIVARKWRADSVPAISKAMACGTFLGFSILSLSNIWPNLTRSDNAIDIFQSKGQLAQEIAIVVLPLILAVTTTMLAFVLMVSALANPMEYRHGQIKAKRLNLDKLSPWDDSASGYLLTALLCLIQASLMGVATLTIYKAGYYEGMDTSPFQIVLLILACSLFILYFQGLKENFGGGPLALFALLHWLIPILVTILIIAIDQDLFGTGFLIASLSPLTMIPLSISMACSVYSAVVLLRVAKYWAKTAISSGRFLNGGTSIRTALNRKYKSERNTPLSCKTSGSLFVAATILASIGIYFVHPTGRTATS